VSQLHAVLIVSQLLTVPSRHTRQHSFLPSEGLEQRFLRFVNLFSFLSLHAVSAARNRREHLRKIKESVSLSDRVYEGLERDTVLHTVQDKVGGIWVGKSGTFAVSASVSKRSVSRAYDK